MKPFDEVRWGQIGCGDVTEKKGGPAFDRVPHSRRVIVMARNADRVKSYAARHGIPRWTTDPERLLANPEVNAVCIATPPDTHLHFASMAAAAGKAVYVEKPMARTYEECGEMIEVCRRAGVPLYVAYYRRSLEKFLRVADLLWAGTIGRPHSVVVRFQRGSPPRPDVKTNVPWRVVPAISGGGYFLDMASHQFDLLDFLLGPITAAAGVVANRSGLYEVEDTVAAAFSFKEGAVGGGVWSFSVDPGAAVDEAEIAGDEGSLRFSSFDDAPVVLRRAGRADESFSHSFPAHVQEPLIVSVVAALRGEGACPSTGESAARASRVIEQITRAGR